MVDGPEFPNLFTHIKRQDWGVAIACGEREGKRSYLFEDGEERTLGAAGIQLMRKVAHPDRDQQQTCAHLLSLLAKRASRPDAQQVSVLSGVEKQLTRFHKKYHAGFFGNEWREDAKVAFARQARGVASQFQDRLASERVAQLLAQQDFATVWNDVVTLVNASGLPAGELPKTKVPAEQRVLAEATNVLLHGSESYDHRFDRWIAAYVSVFRDAPSWQTATALSALMAPVEHVYVEPATFRKQLKALGRPSTFGARPVAAAYTRCLAAAQALANMLATRGEVPRDLLDVHDFIRTTS